MVILISVAGVCAAGAAYWTSPKRRAKAYRAAACMTGAVQKALSRRARTEAAKASRSIKLAPVTALVGVAAGPSRNDVMKSWLSLYA